MKLQPAPIFAAAPLVGGTRAAAAAEHVVVAGAGGSADQFGLASPPTAQQAALGDPCLAVAAAGAGAGKLDQLLRAARRLSPDAFDDAEPPPVHGPARAGGRAGRLPRRAPPLGARETAEAAGKRPLPRPSDVRWPSWQDPYTPLRRHFAALWRNVVATFRPDHPCFADVRRQRRGANGSVRRENIVYTFRRHKFIESLPPDAAFRAGLLGPHQVRTIGGRSFCGPLCEKAASWPQAASRRQRRKGGAGGWRIAAVDRRQAGAPEMGAPAAGLAAGRGDP